MFYSYFKDKFESIHVNISIDYQPQFNMLSRENQIMLEQEVTLEEVKMEVWECGGNRAPGLDGFTFHFIK